MTDKRLMPTLWPTLIAGPMLVVLVGLGTWQLERLDWKTARIDERRARAGGAAITLPRDGPIAADDMYRRARVSGRYIHAAEMYLLNQVRDGTPGVHVITPLVRDDDGPVLMVDRGWAPYDWPAIRARAAAAGPEQVTVTGIIRPAEAPGWLVPDNRPPRNQWYFVDLAGMAARAAVPPLTDYYLFATGEVPAAPSPDSSATRSAWPAANEWRVDLPNNHLAYAVTWFSLAFVLLAIYVVYHARRERAA